MITASIVTYNDHLLNIEAILRSIIASPIRKVWIIDHSDEVFALREELQQYMQRDKEIREHIQRGFQIEYLHEDNTGYGRGNNRAIRLAMEEGSTYHLVVNPDIWFSSDVIPTIWKYMEEHHEVGQIMPKVLFLDGNIQPLAKLLPTPMDMFCRMFLPEWMFARRNKRYELATMLCFLPELDFVHLTADDFIESGSFSSATLARFRDRINKSLSLFNSSIFSLKG
jgi:hypothetical protein